MNRAYKKYRKEDRERVIELKKDKFALQEIAAITGFSKNFNKAFNLPISEHPILIDKDRYRLQHNLMHEELTEYRDACEDKNLVEIADALTDMQEILYGMFAEHGMLDLHDQLYNEVHLSNMSKLNKDGKPLYRVDGKVIKSNLFVKPNIAKVLGV